MNQKRPRDTTVDRLQKLLVNAYGCYFVINGSPYLCLTLKYSTCCGYANVMFVHLSDGNIEEILESWID